MQALERGGTLYCKGIAAAAGASKGSAKAGLAEMYERGFAGARRAEAVACLEDAQSTVRWDALR